MTFKFNEVTVSERIKEFRAQNGITQKELAQQSKVSLRTVQALESGSRISPKSLKLILDSLGIDLEDIENMRFFEPKIKQIEIKTGWEEYIEDTLPTEEYLFRAKRLDLEYEVLEDLVRESIEDRVIWKMAYMGTDISELGGLLKDLNAALEKKVELYKNKPHDDSLESIVEEISVNESAAEAFEGIKSMGFTFHKLVQLTPGVDPVTGLVSPSVFTTNFIYIVDKSNVSLSVSLTTVEWKFWDHLTICSFSLYKHCLSENIELKMEPYSFAQHFAHPDSGIPIEKRSPDCDEGPYPLYEIESEYCKIASESFKRLTNKQQIRINAERENLLKKMSKGIMTLL